MAANTNWKYARLEVGKWNGMRVLAAETACSLFTHALVMPPGLPTKLSQKCVQPLTPVNCVCTPLRTPPPMDVAPNPIL